MSRSDRMTERSGRSIDLPDKPIVDGDTWTLAAKADTDNNDVEAVLKVRENW